MAGEERTHSTPAQAMLETRWPQLRTRRTTALVILRPWAHTEILRRRLAWHRILPSQRSQALALLERLPRKPDCRLRSLPRRRSTWALTTQTLRRPEVHSSICSPPWTRPTAVRCLARSGRVEKPEDATSWPPGCRARSTIITTPEIAPSAT